MTATVTILTGDVLDRLRELPDESVHCVVTSPPYWGLRDYGTGTWEGGDAECDHNVSRAKRRGDLVGCTSWNECRKCGARRVDWQIGLEASPQEHIDRLVEVFREVKRVLRGDGTCWVNYGDIYFSNEAKKAFGDQGEKWISRGSHGTTGRRRTLSSLGLKPKDLVGMAWRVAFALQADGWYLRSDIIWAKCLSGGTRVYARTKKGEQPATLNDIARLPPESVQLWNGEKWTQVVGIEKTPRPDNPLEIVLRNGEVIDCTAEHRWPTRDGVKRADEISPGDVLCGCRLPQPENPSRPSCLSRVRHVFDGRGFPGWRGSISCPTKRTKSNDREVMEVSKGRARQYWDVSVRDEPHTFALASGTLTHNSNPMPESVTDRPTKSHEYLFLLTKSARYWYDADAVREDSATVWNSATMGNRPKFDGISDEQQDRMRYWGQGTFHRDENRTRRNLRTVWTIPTEPQPEAHFATYPQKLVLPCIKAGCPVGGTVLDPFFGSGTTGYVAAKNGRNAIGIELNPEYVEIAKRRLGGDMFIQIREEVPDDHEVSGKA